MTPKTEGGFASLGSLVIVPLLLGIAMIAFVPASTLIEEYEARQLAEHVALTAAQALPDLSEAQRRGVATLHSSGRHRLDGAVSASKRIPGAIDVRVSFQSTAGILLTTLFGHAQSNIVAAHAVVGLRPLNAIIIVPDGPTLAPRTGAIGEPGVWAMHEDEERFAQCPKDALGFAPWKQCQNPILSQVKLAALTLLDHLQENALSHTSVQFYPGDPSRDLDPQEITPGAAFTRLDVDCARLGATLADSIPYALPSSPFRASSPQCAIVPFRNVCVPSGGIDRLDCNVEAEALERLKVHSRAVRHAEARGDFRKSLLQAIGTLTSAQHSSDEIAFRQAIVVLLDSLTQQDVAAALDLLRSLDERKIALHVVAFHHAGLSAPEQSDLRLSVQALRTSLSSGGGRHTVLEFDDPESARQQGVPTILRNLREIIVWRPE